MTIGFKDTDRKTSDVLRDVIASMKGQTVTLRQLLAQMGESGLLLLCGLLSLPFLVPVSIPGVSTVFGGGILLIGVAVTLNRLPWLPSRLADKPLEGDKLAPVLERGVQIISKIDPFIRPRLLPLVTGRVMNRLNGLLLIAAAVLLMLPLSFVPFSNTLPGIAILCLSIGITQRDGLMVAAGYLFNLLTVIYFGVLAWLVFVAGQSLTHLVS